VARSIGYVTLGTSRQAKVGRYAFDGLRRAVIRLEAGRQAREIKEKDGGEMQPNLAQTARLEK